MDLRQKRGKNLFETRYISKKKGTWVVPSEQGKKTYSVNLSAPNPSCTCPDFEARKQKCKHIYAAEYASARETSNRNKNTDNVLTITQAKRKTYPQNWSAYRKAQKYEKQHVMELLAELCGGINGPQSGKMGRPPYPLSDAIYCAVFKLYGTWSAHRIDTDMRMVEDYGFIEKAPDPNTVLRYLQNQDLTPILTDMIVESSRPLVAIEEHFAADGTGFSAQMYDRWFSHKYGKEKQKQGWVKCHLMCGVHTNIVTAAEISDQYAHDSNYLHPLADATANNFNIREISADKGYLSSKNVEKILDLGATSYIAIELSERHGQSLISSIVTSTSKAAPDPYFRGQERFLSQSNYACSHSPNEAGN